MQELALAGHSFGGSLPPSWTSMQKLRVLDVSRNQLTGTLPQTYANLWQLAIARFNDNKIVQVSSSSSSMPEYFQYLVGDGFKLQCPCVANNSEVLLSDEGQQQLVAAARQSSPSVQLVVDVPSSSQCDPAQLPPA
jgi:hypothetical protein